MKDSLPREESSSKFLIPFVYFFRFTMETGHFTQLVWAKTTHVGCGYIKFKDASGSHATQIACNYGPAGNFEGQLIYKAA